MIRLLLVFLFLLVLVFLIFALLVLLIRLLLVFLFLLVLIFLIFVLLILLIFLVLILFLLLLLLLFFKVFEELLDDITILGGLFVFWIDGERLGVLFDGVFPVRFFGLVFLGRLPATNESVSQIVGRVLAQLFILGEERAGKMRNGLLEVAHLVGRGSRIELEFAGSGQGFQPLLEGLPGLVILSALKFLQPGGSGLSGNRAAKDKSDCRIPLEAAVAWFAAFAHKQPKHKETDGEAERPLVALQWLPGGEDSGFGKIHRLDALLKDFPGGIRAERHIEPARG